ncbi:hypothetical protein FIV42_09720 [Persicimonas caeni]|uniref:Carboxypeptidase regulatory-like domain-containing protein n=1 Tax=Persicimonas caeni TaxID=2292766 RepID=A0A4Y6PS01_PERCE|nr:hypothetical protein [Persicimonas caeni]QDG51003.1 hypothetical protein FIV42_09720 [Persicimonas caeni]QED32224.1 hypothetical protein FRD00_09715 [Persicimonas caeni]
MTRWIVLGGLLTGSLLTTSACSADLDPKEQDDLRVACDRIDVEGSEYCVYRQPITETGYECPQDLPNAISFEGHTVCSDEEQLPPDHAQPIREHFEGSPLDGGMDGGSCEWGQLSCDAIGHPSIYFEFLEPDGQAYCGDVTIRGWDDGSTGSPTGWTQCECQNGEMDSTTEGGGCALWASPFDPGETVRVEVEAPGYATFETTATIPCECYSSTSVEVQFENP